MIFGRFFFSCVEFRALASAFAIPRPGKAAAETKDFFKKLRRLDDLPLRSLALSLFILVAPNRWKLQRAYARRFGMPSSSARAILRIVPWPPAKLATGSQVLSIAAKNRPRERVVCIRACFPGERIPPAYGLLIIFGREYCSLPTPGCHLRVRFAGTIWQETTPLPERALPCRLIDTRPVRLFGRE